MLRPNKKISVFSVNGPYLKNLEIFFPEKKIIRKKIVCLAYLKFSDPLSQTH